MANFDLETGSTAGMPCPPEQKLINNRAETATCRNPQRLPNRGRKRLTAVILMLVAGLGLWLGIRIRNDARIERFRSACARASLTGNWEAAEATATEWLQVAPSSDPAKLVQGEALTGLSRHDEALAVLTRIDPNSEEYASALALQANILADKLARPFDAEKLWLQMLDRDATSDAARRHLILFYSITLQRQKLVQQLLSAIALDQAPPETYAYLLLPKTLAFEDGLQVIQRWRENYPNDELLEVCHAFYLALTPPDKSVQRADDRSLAFPGDYEPMRLCLEKYPHNLEALSFHVEVALFEGNADRIAELLRMAPPEAAEDSRFWRYRAWLLRTSSDLVGASAAVDEALHLDPFDWRGYQERANVLRLSGDLAGAESAVAAAGAGKQVEEYLLQQTNPHRLTPESASRMRDFLSRMNAREVLDHLERRMGMFKTQENPGSTAPSEARK